MNFVLFCKNNYAYAILEPITKVLEKRNHKWIWYVHNKNINSFLYKSENFTNNISDIINFKSDVILVPGNEVPHYLRGLKTQIFHGLAGEKKGHFKIRDYFDLYLTQGPYFTKKFNELKSIHKNFEVIETGWSKLDLYNQNKNSCNSEKQNILRKYKKKYIIIYAPTFSPKLTSAPNLLFKLKSLIETNKNYLLFIKFHPLMQEKWVQLYKNLAKNSNNIIFKEEKNIIKFLLMADILISDTSSVIYEFLLLDKPVITFNNISKTIHWENSCNFNDLDFLIKNNLENDPYAKYRNQIYNEFHPYSDGKSSLRMIKAIETYIKKHGIPYKRKLPIHRKLKIYSKFGIPKNNKWKN